MIPLPVSEKPAAIPRTVHQIWVGSEGPPRWVRRSWENWQKALPKSVDLRIWTNAEVGANPVLARTVDAMKDRSPRGLSNMLRVQIVSLFGGMYADVDCAPLGDVSALYEGRSWIACAAKSREQRQMENSCFAFSPHHPFLAAVAQHGAESVRRGLTADFFLGGSRSFRYVWDHGDYALDVRWDYTTSGDLPLRMALWHGPGDTDLLTEYGPFPVAHVFRPRIGVSE